MRYSDINYFDVSNNLIPFRPIKMKQLTLSFIHRVYFDTLFTSAILVINSHSSFLDFKGT